MQREAMDNSQFTIHNSQFTIHNAQWTIHNGSAWYFSHFPSRRDIFVRR